MMWIIVADEPKRVTLWHIATYGPVLGGDPVFIVEEFSQVDSPRVVGGDLCEVVIAIVSLSYLYLLLINKWDFIWRHIPWIPHFQTTKN